MSVSYSTVRPAGREHWPVYPKSFIALRIVQLVLAVIILGLDAFTVTYILTYGNELTLFTSLATMIITIYLIVVEFSPGAYKGYNYWAVLALDVFILIFWLVSFALVAASVGANSGGFTTCDYYTCTTWSLEGDFLTLFACMAAVAGFGGVEFVLFIVSLSIHSTAMHRHRKAGLHCSPSRNHDNNIIPMTNNNNNTTTPPGAVPQQQQQQVPEKHQPAPSYAPIQQQQYHNNAPTTPTPPQGQAPYQPPGMGGAQQYYGQQQQQPQVVVSPQQGGGTYGGAPLPGTYEAQGQQVGGGGHHQQY